MEFIGRHFELNYLDRQYAGPGASFCVVYGRRRIGKTRLLTHWLQTRDHPGFYWLATDSSPAALLRSLSHLVYQQVNGRTPAAADFTYHSWEELLREVARLGEQEGQRPAVILDEFTYAIDAYPDLTYKLQAAWDQLLKERNIMLIISGSHIGMMESEVLAQRSPLYGRATGLLKLEQLPFRDVRALFPGYNAESCIALYSVLGGV